MTDTGLQNDSNYLDMVRGLSLGSETYGIPESASLNGYNRYTEIFESLYDTNTFAANVIDLLPQSMGQNKPTIKYPNAEINGYLQDRVNNIIQHFIDASKIARLVGGSGILIGAKGSLSEPIELYARDPLYYTILEGGSTGELKVDSIDKNPQSKTYLKPLYYRLKFTDEPIHASRILPFYGIKPLTKRQWRRNKYWGISVLVRCYEALKNLDRTDTAIASTVEKFSRIVIKIAELTELSKTQKGRDQLAERSRQMNYSWNLHKTLLLQMGEEVSNLTTNYDGVINAAEHIKKVLASRTDTPYTKLFNSSASKSGLSGSKSDSESVDRGDERQWADYVDTKKVSDWNPNLYKLIDYLLLGLSIEDSEKYEIEHHSILQLTESERSAVEKTKAETAQIYIGTQAVTPVDVAKSLKEGVDLGSVIVVPEQPLMIPGRVPIKASLMPSQPEVGALTPETPNNGLRASQTGIIKDSFTSDDATRAQKKIKWNGLNIAIQYFPFQLRHGKMLLGAYGHIEKTIAADKMAADVYIGTNLESNKIFVIDQWIDGKFDEKKYIIGVNDLMEAKKLYLATMPESFIGGLYETNMEEIKELQKAYDKKHSSTKDAKDENIIITGRIVSAANDDRDSKVSQRIINNVDERRKKLYPLNMADIVDPD
jgi:phage-related protein (TIGR01555 family)